jgi:hypothetical protein
MSGGAYIWQIMQHCSGVIGFFKAVFWPAVVIYRVLELMGM